MLTVRNFHVPSRSISSDIYKGRGHTLLGRRTGYRQITSDETYVEFRFRRLGMEPTVLHAVWHASCELYALIMCHRRHWVGRDRKGEQPGMFR